ncbi:TlpA family protein disulfide reductase [Sphingobacterium faecale]|uniref:TlpA family protein disulfide reductase n=1 Tax=Sphingobacterium faecale TaxID=2803775 RepID=A0ABS1R0N0_9SPHI|nr:TlpA disulfide reductase family protein [Sphingobacterium faecale]MBL1408252.1 TlpA family protein disulfide reductase [Sphingobacterium faecale]
MYKKILLLLFSIFVAVWGVYAAKGKTIVTGKILGFKGGAVSLSYQDYALLSEQEKLEIEVDSKGEFRFEVNLSGPSRAFLLFGSTPTEEKFTLTKGDGKDTTIITTTNRPEMIYLYLVPENKQHIEVTAGSVSSTLQITGKNSTDSRYLNEEDWKFNQYKDKHLKNYFGYVQYDAKQYLAYVEKRRAERTAFLTQFIKEHKMAKHLKHVSTWAIYTDAISARLLYPSMRSSYREDGYQADRDYYNFLTEIDIDPTRIDKGIAYFYFLDFYLKESYKLSGGDQDFFEFVATKISGRSLYEYYAFSLRTNFKRKLYDKFAASSPYPDIAKKVRIKYASMEGMLEGNLAPLVNLQDTAGTRFTFEDWRGKYIYIDLWATWCGPCIAEIPHLKALEHDYQGKNILFVSVSMDRDKDKQKWVDFVREENLSGIQVWLDAENNKQITEAFNILQIPRFVLLDDEGRIIDPNAPRPSDARIRMILDKLR